MKKNSVSFKAVGFCVTLLSGLSVAGCSVDDSAGGDVQTYYEGAGCYVTQSQCKNYPQYSGATFLDGWFQDNYQNNPAYNGNQGEYCKNRALDWSQYCGNDASIVTKTAYIGKGAPSGQPTLRKSYTAGSGCLVTLNNVRQGAAYNCPARLTNFAAGMHDWWAYSFTDKQADKDPVYCEQRGKDYLAWCGLNLIKGASVQTIFRTPGQPDQVFNALSTATAE
jgi:hypothetical protein